MSVYNDVTTSEKFKQFLNQINGRVVSTQKQIQNNTIIVEDVPGKHQWGFFSNGYLREFNWNEMLKRWDGVPLVRGTTGETKDIDSYFSMIDFILERKGQRKKLAEKRITKIKTAGREVIKLLFDHEGAFTPNKAYYLKMMLKFLYEKASMWFNKFKKG